MLYNRRIIAHKDSNPDVSSRNGMLCYVTDTDLNTGKSLFDLRLYRVQTIDGVCSFVVREDEITDACDGPEECPGCSVCDPI